MTESARPKLTPVEKISYGFIFIVLILVGVLKLALPLLAVMFCLFMLRKLHVTQSKLVALLLFVVAISLLTYGAMHFVREAITALPHIANTTIKSFIDWAEGHGIALPFTDFKSLKDLAMETVKEQTHYLGNFANFAKTAVTQIVQIIIGLVVAGSLFLNHQLDLDRGSHRVRNNLYEHACEAITARFQNFYMSFVTVIGAQIIISSINTVLTSIFLFTIKLPYAPVVVGVTFLCGLLPVIGNLISNTVIVGIAFTMSPKMALIALIYLVVIHKLEYFLNSKIIGDRIRSPVWLTLLGLVIGEKLIGIPGMILAPVVLHYVKAETSLIEAKKLG